MPFCDVKENKVIQMITKSQMIILRLLEWWLNQRNGSKFRLSSPTQTYWINLHFNKILRGFNCTLKFESTTLEHIYSFPPPKSCFFNYCFSHSHLLALTTHRFPHHCPKALSPICNPSHFRHHTSLQFFPLPCPPHQQVLTASLPRYTPKCIHFS